MKKNDLVPYRTSNFSNYLIFSIYSGVKRGYDRRVISGIIYVLKHGLQWKDVPKKYGSHKTIYNRFIRWSKKNKIFTGLVSIQDIPEQLQIDST